MAKKNRHRTKKSKKTEATSTGGNVKDTGETPELVEQIIPEFYRMIGMSGDEYAKMLEDRKELTRMEVIAIDAEETLELLDRGGPDLHRAAGVAEDEWAEMLEDIGVEYRGEPAEQESSGADSPHHKSDEGNPSIDTTSSNAVPKATSKINSNEKVSEKGNTDTVTLINYGNNYVIGKPTEQLPEVAPHPGLVQKTEAAPPKTDVRSGVHQEIHPVKADVRSGVHQDKIKTPSIEASAAESLAAKAGDLNLQTQIDMSSTKVSGALPGGGDKKIRSSKTGGNERSCGRKVKNACEQVSCSSNGATTPRRAQSNKPADDKR